MELKTIKVKKGTHTYDYDVIQQLKHNTPVVVTIGNTDKDRFGNELPKKLLGLTFLAQRTGSHSIQPLVPFGEWFYNIYAHNISKIVSLEHEPQLYLKAEKALMPIHSRGDKKWFRRGVLHRDDDLPAVINSSGSCWWYRHGEHQRTGFKPAYVSSNGSKTWYNKNKPADDEFMEFIRKKAPEYFI